MRHDPLVVRWQSAAQGDSIRGFTMALVRHFRPREENLGVQSRLTRYQKSRAAMFLLWIARWHLHTGLFLRQ